ncbi:MAG: ribokinase [bacterium]
MGCVAVVGSSNTDLTVLCSTLPGRGETVLGGELYQAAGGKGANQAVAAARAGARVALVAAVGSDDFGRATVEGFERDGIDTGSVVVKPDTPSGTALILVEESGENLIAVAPGANAELAPGDVDAAADVIRGAGALLLQLEIPMDTVRRAAEIAAPAGVPVLLNPAPMPERPLPADLLAVVDYLVPNQSELLRLTGAKSEESAAGELFEAGVSALIVTRGRAGARIITARGRRDVASIEVEAVDAVGAGDCFCGYLAAGIADGAPLADAVRVACAAAALSVTRRGAQPSMPRRSEVMDLLDR